MIAQELSKCNVSIAPLSELWLTGSGLMTVQPPVANETMMLFYSGGDKQEAGVGFMVAVRLLYSSVKIN